jgi:hypothetical protein
MLPWKFFRSTVITRFTDFGFTNFRYNEPYNSITSFEFANIIFAATKNELIYLLFFMIIIVY